MSAAAMIRGRVVTRRWTVQKALSAVGVPRDMIYPKRKRGLGRRSLLFSRRTDLWRMADAARTARRSSLKVCHPDRGGCQERTVCINRHWSKIIRWFERKGIQL